MYRLLACTLALFASSCAFEAGSGHLVEEHRYVSAFTEVELHDGFQADVSVGFDQQVQVIADDNLMEHVGVHVAGHRLVVEIDDVIPLDATLRVRISVPELTGVSAHGGSDIVAAGIDSPSFSVDLSGGSHAELIGGCGNLGVDASGGSVLRGYSMACTNADVELSGGSDAELTVTQYVSVEASGGSELNVRGGPRISQDLSGGSEVHYR